MLMIAPRDTAGKSTQVFNPGVDFYERCRIYFHSSASSPPFHPHHLLHPQSLLRTADALPLS